MGVKCSATNAGQRCLSRTAAMRSGEMFFTHRAPMGWVFPADRMNQQDVPPYRHRWCPFCGEPLPASSPETLWEKFQRALDEERDQGDRGEGPE